MKVIFAGTPEFSVYILDSIIKAGHDIVAVYTQPPRPAGRGKKEQKSPVHIYAEKSGICVRTPKTLRDKQVQMQFDQLKADVAVIVAYGLILPKEILDSCYCINIHASMLPRWRGAAPIQRAIEAGDDKTGITIMQMDEGLDTGDMLIWEEIAITKETTAGSLHDELSVLGAKLIVRVLDEKDELQSVKQQGEATYADKISKIEAKINWNEMCEIIELKVRAFNPFPAAYFEYEGEKFKIFKCDYQILSHDLPFGTITADSQIACKDGYIKPILIQRQGRKTMHIDELLRGFSFFEGYLLK